MGKCEVIRKRAVQIVPVGKEGNEKPRVKLEDGTIIEAELMVGSDGMTSRTREDHGMRVSGYSYNHTGIVCSV